MPIRVRVIEGDEREHMFTIFSLIDSERSWCSQRSITEIYRHAGKLYSVSFFEDGEIMEEIEEYDDIQQDKGT